MEFEVNKGIGKSVEFKSLKAQYLVIFAVGLLLTFLVVIVMYMANANSYLCVFVGLVLALSITYFTFYLNKKYGEHGLMKVFVRQTIKGHIVNRVPIKKLLRK